jgi:hypothetical protein
MREPRVVDCEVVVHWPSIHRTAVVRPPEQTPPAADGRRAVAPGSVDAVLLRQSAVRRSWWAVVTAVVTVLVTVLVRPRRERGADDQVAAAR